MRNLIQGLREMLVRLGAGELGARLVASLRLRRTVINLAGIGLTVLFTLWFVDWVRPSLTSEQLFTPPVIGPQPVKVAFVSQRTIERTATYTGTAYPFERVVVNSRTSGFVEQVNVYPGDRIAAGTVLIRLETSELTPRLEHAEADLTFLRGELRRDQKLAKSGAISRSELARARNKERVAAARVKLLKTKIGYATITASSDGWISERKVDPGQYIQKGKPLLAYERLDRVRIRFNVAEQDLAMIRVGSRAVLEFPQIPRLKFVASAWREKLLPGYDNPAIDARITAVFPRIDARSRLGVVEVVLPNPGTIFRSNSYVIGHLVTGRVEKAWVVPARALTPMPGGKTVVFIAPAFADQGEVSQREVKVGLRNGREAQITEGLTENTYVVVSGNRGLTDGENVAVLERTGGPK